MMDNTLTKTIEDFGARVASVWEGLRPTTRTIVERALVASQTPASGGTTVGRAGGAAYDARAEWELSRLLAALDDRATEAGVGALNDQQTRELRRMAETCALVLHLQARSAEVFAQLLERALLARDYARVDALADTILKRLAPTEICELARHPNPPVRAIAHEALLQTPISALVGLLNDPVDSDIARDALERQAAEFGSEEARWVVNALDRADDAEEDL
ncbi:MAG TPA: hypothetical protein VM866_06995 [Pyrinomonadaceae bacterium]|jgi:hypothetical protein|nr:hypothetical protein [Pyrinomonadaceae bacterium]